MVNEITTLLNPSRTLAVDSGSSLEVDTSTSSLPPLVSSILKTVSPEPTSTTSIP
ncbi:MAG: hypothetical protein LM564_04735 [Desulfurococcaceae archaeon]|nr:hypothetical protein [Desulfurococcaceae archaeon]